jgi:hypothetical protein
VGPESPEVSDRMSRTNGHDRKRIVDDQEHATDAEVRRAVERAEREPVADGGTATAPRIEEAHLRRRAAAGLWAAAAFVGMLVCFVHYPLVSPLPAALFVALGGEALNPRQGRGR